MKKFKRINNLSDKDCEYVENIFLVRLALLKSFWKVTGGSMKNEEFEYVQGTDIELKYKLGLMHTEEAEADFVSHQNQIIDNAEFFN